MMIRKYVAFLLVLLLLVGCNLPTKPTSTVVPSIPPVDLTVTALFETAMAEPPTDTPAPPAVATSTQPPATLTASPVPATNTPVSTSTHTAVPTIPGARGGVSVVAPFMSTAPTIDGDWTEWKTAAKEYPATNVVFGKSQWQNADDLSASYYVGWDSNFLYIAVKVHDDKYVQLAHGANIYKGDSIELLIDTNVAGDYYVKQLNTDDYQIGISPGNPSISDENPEVYRWFPSGKAGSLTDVTVSAQDEGPIYRLEAAIPWSDLGITPSHGLHLGFGLSVSDDDQSGKQSQDSMVSSLPNRNLVDPTTWGDLLLK
jgi:hypothetical protein